MKLHITVPNTGPSSNQPKVGVHELAKPRARVDNNLKVKTARLVQNKLKRPGHKYEGPPEKFK